MRIRNEALALSVLLSTACQVSNGEQVSQRAQALQEDDYYDALYDSAFEDAYPVASFTKVMLNGDQADYYYPSVAPGSHVDAFPMVPVLQGGLVDKGLYSMFAERLASYGFVVVVPNHYQGLAPGMPPQLFTSQRVATAVLTELQALDSDPSSPLYGIVDTDNMGLTGHSFGGAAALFTVEGSCLPPFCFGPFFARPPQLKAAAVYGTHTTSPQTGQLLDPNTSAAPVMIVQGELDDADLATATYGLLEPARGLSIIDGLNHWGITNIQNPPSNTPDPAVQTVGQKQSVKRVARWMALWFRAHLLGDPVATELVFESGGVEHATVTSQM